MYRLGKSSGSHAFKDAAHESARIILACTFIFQRSNSAKKGCGEGSRSSLYRSTKKLQDNSDNPDHNDKHDNSDNNDNNDNNNKHDKSYKSGGAKVQVTGHRSGYRSQATGQVTGQITGHTQKQ